MLSCCGGRFKWWKSGVYFKLSFFLWMKVLSLWCFCCLGVSGGILVLVVVSVVRVWIEDLWWVILFLSVVCVVVVKIC